MIADKCLAWSNTVQTISFSKCAEMILYCQFQYKIISVLFTDVCFASFFSGGFTTMAVIYQPERKLA